MELQKYEIEHLKLLEEISSECALFLKREDLAFPISEPTKIDLFGNGVRYLVKGGTGSGDVDVREFLNVEQAFEQAGFEVTSKDWLSQYDEIRKEAKKEFIEQVKKEAKQEKIMVASYSVGQNLREVEYDLQIDKRSDIAIYVLSRIAGEGQDRKYIKGDFYLTDTEIKNILLLNQTYERFLLVLNVSSVIDLTPVLAVNNILLLSQLGSLTGETLVDIVLGKKNPSGKLSDTWAKKDDYPYYEEFGKLDDTEYKEDIYVGYRYFDSFEVEPIFEFGYGKSYTYFDILDVNIRNEKDEFFIKATIKNIGSYPGREVIQLYLKTPANHRDVYQKLVAFAKSKEINPGETCVVELSFSLSDFPVFNEKDSYILNKGIYHLLLGNSSRNTNPVASINLKEEITLKKVKTTLGNDVIYHALTFFNKPLKALDKNFELSSKDFAPIVDIDYKLFEVEKNPLVDSLSTDELILLSLGDIKSGIEGMIGQSCSKVLGGAGETCLKVPSVTNCLSMADGPAGLRIAKEYIQIKTGKKYKTITEQTILEVTNYLSPIVGNLLKNEKNRKKKGIIHHQYTTAIPVATALAQSFNMDVLVKCGDIVREEMVLFNVDLWLAPAMNIHRHVLCGRNFEYYSEDPLLSAKCAAAICKSVQKSLHKGIVIKHYACNNQETNRTNSNSIVSSRALREIYLYGFEKVIKEAYPYALMVSYNLLNGEHTTENYELLNDITRCEFGFDGLLMTDWYVTGQNMIRKNNKYRYSLASKNIKAGINLCMPGGKGDVKEINSALKKGDIDIDTLKRNASIVIKNINILKND